jgi:hypothetical protein
VVYVHVPELGRFIFAFLNMTGMKNTVNKREPFPFLSRELVKQDLNGRLLIRTNL